MSTLDTLGKSGSYLPIGAAPVNLEPLSIALKGCAIVGVGVSWIIAQVPVVAPQRFPWEAFFAMVGTAITGYYAMKTTERGKEEKKDRIIRSLREKVARQDEKLEALKLRHPMEAIDIDKTSKKTHAGDSGEFGGK